MSSFAPTDQRRARNGAVIADLQANRGRTSSGQTLVILTTVGERTGQAHRMPLCVRQDGADLVIAASAGGQPRHPQWYRNLAAGPEVVVEYLGETYPALATTVLNSVDRDRLFAMLSQEITGLYGYQDRCREERQIPIIRLGRVDPGSALPGASATVR